MTRQVIIPANRLPAEGSRSQLRVESRGIVVFNVHGTLYAIDDTCPHAGASLANGKVEGHTVQCRAHGLRFDLLTGCMTVGHSLSVRSYAIAIRDEQAYLTLPAADESPSC